MTLNDVYLRLKQADITYVVLPRVTVRATVNTLLSFFLSRNFIVFLVPLMLLLIGATSSLFADRLSGFGRAVYWLSMLIGYMGSAFLMILVQASCSSFLGIKRFFSPVTCIPVALGAMTFAELATNWVLNLFQTSDFMYMPMLLPQYLLIVGIESIVIVWVLPPYLDRLGENEGLIEDTPENSATGVVTANGQSFLIKDIKFVQANQHYVTVQLDDREVLVRSTFKGILTQLPTGAGLQVHRSCWVANSCVDIARSLNEIGHVVLCNGEKVTVARSRTGAVRDWLASLACSEGLQSVGA
ncbi:LytTR family DNA-binding domain-containing protein [Ruegeria sp. SCPT10]|uniref:LytTR family DNA-binding domain-containing protein n=1 Tax=Ruegeria sp. SCP10 TaxID=3141377 RepID=UPI00333C9D2F